MITVVVGLLYPEKYVYETGMLHSATYRLLLWGRLGSKHFFYQVGISNSKLAPLMRNAIIVAVMGISPSPILSNRTHMGVNSQKYGKSPPWSLEPIRALPNISKSPVVFRVFVPHRRRILSPNTSLGTRCAIITIIF